VNRRKRIVAGALLLVLATALLLGRGFAGPAHPLAFAASAVATPSPTPSPPPVSPGTRALNYLFAALCIAGVVWIFRRKWAMGNPRDDEP